ncbi:SAM-dependent methyltransferase [Desulfosediminicola ganghwensis]|uniref:SAM-dependent methyltransferase n=1 Tax=Desulfosediminicola ganghwensis TaxID=2569540 RepID=UPI0010AC5266|nr:SAM-dependent methyltransferase [Desulfosediminicola ganghwensis]
MDSDKASRSAAIIAAHRAYEYSRTDSNRICSDQYAKSFLPDNFSVIGESELPGEETIAIFRDLVPGFHEFFLARTRYIDDYLAGQLTVGLEQLVILGAGFDTRAHRFEELGAIRVFEVDHPATQAIKKAKVEELFSTLPDHVSYVPIDFHRENLELLSDYGYDRSKKSLFIMEGVIMYLDLEAIDETLLFISRNSAEGSRLIFDYTYPGVLENTIDRKEAKAWLEITKKSDEPLLFGIEDDAVDDFLSRRGFTDITTVSSDFFNKTYYQDDEERQATPILAIAHARVP